MRRAFACAVVCAWAGVWLACGAFEDATTPTGDSPDAAPADGPATSDAIAAPDGALDADAGCTAYFCDGFERTTPLEEGWNGLPVVNNGTLTLSNEHPHSGLRSMQLFLFGDAGSEAGRAASIAKTIPPDTTRVFVDFWISYESSPSTETGIANLYLRSFNGNIILTMRSDGFLLAEQYRIDGGPIIAANKVLVGDLANRPRHITIAIGTNLVDGGPGARLTVDDKSGILKLDLADPLVAQVLLGATYSAPGDRDDDAFWYDDLVIEASP